MVDLSLPVRDSWVLKGGYALALRFREARSTRDLDFTIRTGLQVGEGDRVTALREHLQLAALVRLPDYFAFIVGEAMSTLYQAPEGGARFPVEARLDGRTFVTFHVDLGLVGRINAVSAAAVNGTLAIRSRRRPPQPLQRTRHGRLHESKANPHAVCSGSGPLREGALEPTRRSGRRRNRSDLRISNDLDRAPRRASLDTFLRVVFHHQLQV